jgi:hypothetical protein
VNPNNIPNHDESKTEKSFTFNNNESVKKFKSNRNDSIDNKSQIKESMPTMTDNVFSMKVGNDIIPITSIIPESRLNHSTDDDILFQSNIKKLLNQKVGNHISQSFCDRFIFATRTYIRLYKSKEQFLVLSKPTNVIYINSIKSVKRFHIKGNNKYNLFAIELGDIFNKTGKYL